MSVTYDREGNAEQALECIEKAIANKPQSLQLQLLRGKLNEGLGRYFEAEAAFRKSVELDPTGAQIDLVNFLLRRQRFAEAIAIVESAGDEGANAALIVELNVTAARAMMSQRVGDPVPYLEAALRRSPGSGTALAAYEQLLTERGDAAGVARLQAEELGAPLVVPTDYVRRAFRLLGLGRAAEASDVAERGLELAPLNAELRFNAALAKIRLGRDAEAADHLARIDDRFPEVYPDAMQMRAALLMRMGDVAGAAVAMNAWVVSQGDDPNAVVTGAQWLARSGARAEAKALLEKHAESDRRVSMELASMLLKDGDVEGAGAVADRALR
jgi:tetratricopeptide (TPR) repeat protein